MLSNLTLGNSYRFTKYNFTDLRRRNSLLVRLRDRDFERFMFTHQVTYEVNKLLTAPVPYLKFINVIS